jgi:hypothetical protein
MQENKSCKPAEEVNMRRKIVVLVAVILVCAQAVVGKEPKLDLSTRFLILRMSRSRVGVLLKQAADAGYQVLFGSLDGEGLLLEKSAATAPPRDYLLVPVSVKHKELKELNEAAAKGYRVVARTLLSYEVYGGSEQFAVMERTEGAESQPPVEFINLGPGHLQEEMCKASARGFRFVAIGPITLGTFTQAATCQVLMEGPPGKQGESGTAASEPTEVAATCPYWVVEASKRETVEEGIKEAAGRGYKAEAAFSPGGSLVALLTSSTFVVMEKAQVGGPAKEYVFLQKAAYKGLEGQIQQAAAQGYRAVGGTFYVAGKHFLAMEKGGGPGEGYRYSLVTFVGNPLKKDPVQEVEKQIAQAADDGYSPIAIGFSARTQPPVVLLEKRKDNRENP